MESIKGGMRTLALDIANKKLEEKVEEEEPEPADKDDEVIICIGKSGSMYIYFLYLGQKT